MRNEINVTCHCQKSGYEWSSRYGICIDVDECSNNQHNCSLDTGESCFNLPGHFDCICQFGYNYNSKKKGCELDLEIEELLHKPKNPPKESKEKSFLTLIRDTFRKSSANIFVLHHSLLLCTAIYFF